MIQWSEMPKVMAMCHVTIGPRQCVSFPQVLHELLMKHNILKINM